jgi:hypothetical protein
MGGTLIHNEPMENVKKIHEGGVKKDKYNTTLMPGFIEDKSGIILVR